MEQQINYVYNRNQALLDVKEHELLCEIYFASEVACQTPFAIPSLLKVLSSLSVCILCGV